MGSRDPDNGDIWILYRGVTARHEGMTLTSDSAHFDTRQNSFTAFMRRAWLRFTAISRHPEDIFRKSARRIHMMRKSKTSVVRREKG